MTVVAAQQTAPSARRRPRWRHAAALTATVGVVIAGGVTAAPLAAAEPVERTAAAPNGSRLVTAADGGNQRMELSIYSASMDRTVPVTVLLPAEPASAPSPTLYLLNGAGGGEDSATWEDRTDVREFMSDKNTYVVTPNAGRFSYYTDWQEDDEELGRNKWATFLSQELPPIIDGAFNTSGRNAIAGISSSTTAVLNLAAQNPGLFQAVGSYSGCDAMSTPWGNFYVRIVVEGRGGADLDNMWGPFPGQGWRDNDPVLNAEKLRGTTLYISNATGLPGQYDTLEYVEDPERLIDQIGVGGAIEAATWQCTQMLRARLAELNIPATFDFPIGGTHSWMYWQDQLHKSWPTLARAIGA